MSHTPVSIVSLNCYLIPYLFTFRNPESAASRYKQYERAQRIGKFVANKDLIFLQEVWGSQIGTIQESIPSHNMINGYESKSIFGYFGNVFDSVASWWYEHGGLWSATRKDLPIVYFNRHTFTVSETSSRKGVQAMLINMSSVWGDKYLLVVNSHLDPNHTVNKRKQFQEIYDFIGKTLVQLQTIPFKSKFFYKDCGVILLGDFNTSSHSREYERFMELYGMRDLYAEHLKNKTLTEEPTYDSDNNSLVMWQSKQRIDYIFSFDSFDFQQCTEKSNQKISLMPLQASDFKIETQPKGEELSDHWALVTSIVPQN
jgi:endonuclease/exonuclease/phosphatase family metal-dependent hydrolase